MARDFIFFDFLWVKKGGFEALNRRDTKVSQSTQRKLCGPLRYLCVLLYNSKVNRREHKGIAKKSKVKPIDL